MTNREILEKHINLDPIGHQYCKSRIKRLLEVLSAYSFNLYYMKGKDMILSDFLSGQRIDKSNPHEIIPISFDMKAILKDKY